MDTKNFFIAPIDSVLCETSKFGVQNYPDFVVTIITPGGNLDTGLFGHQMTPKFNQIAPNGHQITPKGTRNDQITPKGVQKSPK